MLSWGMSWWDALNIPTDVFDGLLESIPAQIHKISVNEKQLNLPFKKCRPFHLDLILLSYQYNVHLWAHEI